MSLFDQHYEIVICKTCPLFDGAFKRSEADDCLPEYKRMCEATRPTIEPQEPRP